MQPQHGRSVSSKEQHKTSAVLQWISLGSPTLRLAPFQQATRRASFHISRVNENLITSREAEATGHSQKILISHILRGFQGYQLMVKMPISSGKQLVRLVQCERFSLSTIVLIVEPADASPLANRLVLTCLPTKRGHSAHILVHGQR
ncbi:hypothetical protein CSKR_114256 [Clonorchis sinensis]|uniref:Uncharacterized protein n=1 Tax=Clonorchis sinensis TaxID=79923 RepID=A0A419Q0Y6_CLOSI|nr:hypothetical protein CSKR_114256 [Clonorchis sinensis]